jgi:hypothetical protein
MLLGDLHQDSRPCGHKRLVTSALFEIPTCVLFLCLVCCWLFQHIPLMFACRASGVHNVGSPWEEEALYGCSVLGHPPAAGEGCHDYPVVQLHCS